MSTASFIARLGRLPGGPCATHGDVVEVRPKDGVVFDRGYLLQCRLFDCVFSDRHRQTFRLAAGTPVVAEKIRIGTLAHL